MRLSLNQRGSASASAIRAVKRMSLQRRSRASIAIDRLLAARRFHPRAIRCLATREHYAEAAGLLSRIADPRHPQASLASIFTDRLSPDVLRYRLASRFGLVSEQAREGHKVEPVTIDCLRRDRRKGARIVLAAIGDLPWKEMNRSERAMFALARLVSARVVGAS